MWIPIVKTIINRLKFDFWSYYHEITTKTLLTSLKSSHSNTIAATDQRLFVFLSKKLKIYFYINQITCVGSVDENVPHVLLRVAERSLGRLIEELTELIVHISVYPLGRANAVDVQSALLVLNVSLVKGRCVLCLRCCVNCRNC